MSKLNDFLTSIIIFVVTILIVGLFSFINGFLVMILWNKVVPAVFNYHTITYWQAFGLSWLFKSSNTNTRKKINFYLTYDK